MLGLAIKPILDALVTDDQLYLRVHHVPPIYESGVRYMEEPVNQAKLGGGPTYRVEEFAAIPAVIERGWGDCFPEGTLLFTEGHELQPIENVSPGMKIWGLQGWTPVESKKFKGNLPVSAIQMNNGSTAMLTADHHVYTLECPEHSRREKLCSCAPTARRELRLRVSELEPGMVLATPERLPFGHSDGDPDRAYVEGLFLSDGWSDKPSRFCISGKDGEPKEEQKHAVKQICDRLGIASRWDEKYIAVNDGDWALRMQLMGSHAPEKRLLSLDLGEAQAIATLRGIMADSGKNTRGPGRTFTSTSRILAIQTRLLQKMVGVACGYSYVPDHGGLGRNPVHRLNARQKSPGNDTQEKLLRVRSVEHEVLHSPCWDIQTEDHHVYLPEHDVAVSNCDDLGPWRCAELRENGEAAKIRIQWKKNAQSGQKLFHIIVRRADGRIEDPSLLLGMR